ncbi:MAG: hypothetical protein HGA97_09680 [Chlorobiaceae bacterium]|nr:hypothetical protein [Chlorobiaceae bacterium]
MAKLEHRSFKGERFMNHLMQNICNGNAYEGSDTVKSGIRRHHCFAAREYRLTIKTT